MALNAYLMKWINNWHTQAFLLSYKNWKSSKHFFALSSHKLNWTVWFRFRLCDVLAFNEYIYTWTHALKPIQTLVGWVRFSLSAQSAHNLPRMEWEMKSNKKNTHAHTKLKKMNVELSDTVDSGNMRCRRDSILNWTPTMRIVSLCTRTLVTVCACVCCSRCVCCCFCCCCRCRVAFHIYWTSDSVRICSDYHLNEW